MEDVIDYYNEYLDDANIMRGWWSRGMDLKIAGHIFSNTRIARRILKSPMPE